MGHVSYFGGAEKKYERVFVPDLGSLTSIHDRWAAEAWKVNDPFSLVSLVMCVFFASLYGTLGFRARQLFYYLKGGQVDYGEEHSKACGHSRFGRGYKQGLNTRPLVLLPLRQATIADEMIVEVTYISWTSKISCFSTI